MIYADECVIAHTDETEFNEFLADKKSEALRDRMIMVRIPFSSPVRKCRRTESSCARWSKRCTEHGIEKTRTAPPYKISRILRGSHLRHWFHSVLYANERYFWTLGL